MRRFRTPNPKQKKFVGEYFINGKSGVDAVIAAGYTSKRNIASNVAKRLLKQASVQRYIDEIRLIANIPDMFVWKLEKLASIVNANMPPDGDCRVAIAAIVELNKMEGHYAPTKSVRLDLKQNLDMKRMLEISRKIEASNITPAYFAG